MSENQETLNISDLYGYDDDDLSDSSYPIHYFIITKAHKTDAKLQQNLVSHKDYTFDTFCGGDQKHCLIWQNSKIFSPTALQKKTLYWYHEMLFHLGETHTEHTINTHFYWKGLCTTVHNVRKKCPTWKRTKTINYKYFKLPPKQAETKPWETLCVDRIKPYTIPRKGKNSFKLWCLTMINTATGWFEMPQILNKNAAEIADIFGKT